MFLFPGCVSYREDFSISGDVINDADVI